MPTTTPVVVAVGPGGSTAAVEYAAAEAVRRGRDLRLVHAVETPADEATGAALLEHAVRHAADRVGGLVDVISQLAVAAAVPTVVAAAHDAPLVVVGRCPEADHTHPYVRSITGGVAARATVPVVSVPDDWAGRSGVPRIVAGVDDPTQGDALVLQAFAVAQAQRAPLTVLSAWWRPTGADKRPLTQVDDAMLPAVLRTDLDRMAAAAGAAYPDVSVTVQVRNAPPRDALVQAAESANLLILGRHDPLLPTGSHLGPVARAVLREAVCPVLLVAPRRAHRVQHAGHRIEERA